LADFASIMMRSWIELHDSVVNAIAVSDESVTIHLTAYVHRWEQRDGSWAGTGWTQPVTIVVRKPTMPIATIETPVDVSDGSVRVNEAVHDNLVPVPFESIGAVRVVMHLVDGAVIEVVGDQMKLAATGDGRFVEDLPAGLRPPDLQP
jgi:hypothetical protein